MDLFDYSMQERIKKDAPLADRMPAGIWSGSPTVLTIEEKIHAGPTGSSWDTAAVTEALEEAGFKPIDRQQTNLQVRIRITRDKIRHWFRRHRPGRPSYGDHLAQQLSEEEIGLIRERLIEQLVDQPVAWKTTWFLVTAIRAGGLVAI